MIGAGIGKSSAPRLHRLAGGLSGIEVTYDLIQLAAGSSLGSFEQALSECRAKGYAGVNVTHPFKEGAARLVEVASEQVRRLGAINTVRFEPDRGPQGFNTDYTGFKRAFETRFPGDRPGVVAIAGAGGVGRAIAFGLVDLYAEEIRLFDPDRSKSATLATALQTQTDVRVALADTLAQACAGTDGLVNATPIGMHQYPGTPFPRELIGKQRWAFDAIYTPRDTPFMLDAAAAGLQVLEGYELFFYQGVDAFAIFTGVGVDEAALREALAQPPQS